LNKFKRFYLWEKRGKSVLYNIERKIDEKFILRD